jgi:hypothetical protein
LPGFPGKVTAKVKIDRGLVHADAAEDEFAKLPLEVDAFAI